MLKNYWRIVSRLEQALDNVIIVGAFFLTYELHELFRDWGVDERLGIELKHLAEIQSYLVLLGFAIPLYNSVLSLLGAYRSMRLSTALELARITLSASAIVFVLNGALLYLLKLDLSRSFVALYCALVGIGVFTLRVSALSVLRFFRVRGRNFRNLLIAGDGEQADSLAKEVLSQPELGIRLVGYVSYSEQKVKTANGESLVVSAANFEAALKQNAIDEVLFTDVGENFARVKSLVEIASEEGVGVSLVPDFFSLELLRSDVSYFGRYPLVHYRSSPSERSSYIVKRLIDFVGAAVLFVLFIPLMLLIALAIKLDSKGPILFVQRRVGLNGRQFSMLKFRSMYDGAERLRERLERKNEMKGPVFKIENDPRVTRVGRVLRRYSLDELPQLINVLLGDMSLVGPRPPLPSEVNLYERKQRRRLSMRPGLTCIWQVSGRNDIIDFDEWARLDLEYIDNWSLGLDLKLLLKTIPAVLRGSGA